MPRDMCDFAAATPAELPKELVVFEYDDNLVFAHETLGRRLPPLRPGVANEMVSGVSYFPTARRNRSADRIGLQLEQIFRSGRMGF